MSAMRRTVRGFEKLLKEDFEERLPEMRDDPYWQDVISELADTAVPVYTADRVALWLDYNCPDVDEPELIAPGASIPDQIGVILYEQATAHLWELARDAGLD